MFRGLLMLMLGLSAFRAEALPRVLRGAARQEFIAHARELNLLDAKQTLQGEQQKNRLIRAIFSAERRAALGFGATRKFIDQQTKRFSRAQKLVPEKMRVLFGFSRIIDTKASLTPSLLERASRDL